MNVLDQRVSRFWALFGTTLLFRHPGAFFLAINRKDGFDGIKATMRACFQVEIPDGTTSPGDVAALQRAMDLVLRHEDVKLADVLAKGE